MPCIAISYPRLAVAVGARNNTFGIPGVEEHSHYLKVRGRLARRQTSTRSQPLLACRLQELSDARAIRLALVRQGTSPPLPPARATPPFPSVAAAAGAQRPGCVLPRRLGGRAGAAAPHRRRRGRADGRGAQRGDPRLHQGGPHAVRGCPPRLERCSGREREGMRCGLGATAHSPRCLRLQALPRCLRPGTAHNRHW